MQAPVISFVFALSLATAGCIGFGPTEEATADTLPATFTVAFSVKDDFTSFVDDTKPLADWLTRKTGVPTTILPVEDESASIQALANGQAQAAFMDGGAAWVGWTTFGLEAIAADEENGRQAYTAHAWVKKSSGITTLEGLRDSRSCHTGELKSAGMLVPMGYLIGNGFIDLEGLDKDDIASLQQARERFFSASTIGGGYEGAFQCLATGNGDVAFVKDSTWDDYCAGDERRDWCLDRDAFTLLPAAGFASVPSHPVMVPGDLPAKQKDRLRAALLALNDSDEGRAILADVLDTSAIAAVTTADHLGSYGDAIKHVPGIEAYLAKKQIRK